MKDVAPARGPFRAMSALGRVTAGALLISALAYFAYIAILYAVAGLIVPLVIIGAVVFVAAIIVATGWRWAPALGALVALGTSIGGLMQPYFPNDLAHPSGAGQFIPVFIIEACTLVAIVAGIAATIQNYRRPAGERPAPRGLSTILTVITGIVLGAMLVSCIAAANPQGAAASSSAQSGGELVAHMGITSFVQDVVLVPKGSKLKLTDDGQYTHIIQNGAWDASSTPKNATEPGAPAVNALTINSGSVEIGPFNTAGIYHLYCTVHRGMNLTVVVQ
ncbi:MAG: hypothetical protein M3Z08_01145 [Chloroflexota bacterium]|nr:hypothetical protein [Chloroflexota bacterium]